MRKTNAPFNVVPPQARPGGSDRMTGLLLLLVAGLWLVVVVFVSRWVGSLAKAPWRRAVVGGLAFALLLPLPLLDEIVGGYQFRSLCRANASEYRLGVPDPEGRTAKVVVDPSNRYISGKNLRIRHSRVTYLDAKTGEEILSFDRYVAEGGVPPPARPACRRATPAACSR